MDFNFEGYKWIKVKHFKEETYGQWSDEGEPSSLAKHLKKQLDSLREHHVEETTFLIEKVRELGKICQSTKEILEALAKRTGHDLCWHEPESISKLMSLFEVSPPTDLQLPKREEFQEGCKKYEASLYESS